MEVVEVVTMAAPYNDCSRGQKVAFATTMMPGVKHDGLWKETLGSRLLKEWK